MIKYEQAHIRFCDLVANRGKRRRVARGEVTAIYSHEAAERNWDHHISVGLSRLARECKLELREYESQYQIRRVPSRKLEAPTYEELVALIWKNRHTATREIKSTIHWMTVRDRSIAAGFERKSKWKEGESAILRGPCISCGDITEEPEVDEEGKCPDCAEGIPESDTSWLDREREAHLRRMRQDPMRRWSLRRKYIMTSSGHPMRVSRSY